MSIIELSSISVAFKQKKEVVKAVDGVALRIQEGDIFGVLDFSGAGKSTLVRTVNLLQKPGAGDIVVQGTTFVKNGQIAISGKELQKHRREIGMIFQGFNLLNETNVLENIALTLRHGNLSDEEIEKKSLRLLELIDLREKADFYPSQLSGGRKQRVAIAHTLVSDPEILLSGEATSALDPQNTNQISDLLKKLGREPGLTIVLIVYQMGTIKKAAGRVAVMGHGHLIGEGSLRQIFLEPKKELTRGFVGGSSAIISIFNKLNLNKLSENGAICQLTHSLSNITKSIIIELYSKLGVEASMLYRNVELLSEKPTGTLVVLLKGDFEEQKAVREFLAKENILVTELGERGQIST